MADALTLRLMTEDEAYILVGWAADEGWNPGLHDAGIFWATDPQAFVAAELEGELIGGGAITTYGSRFGFMGLFIVRPAFRGRGLGARLWRARLSMLRSRLDEGATIGMDGVFDMQDWYARSGFTFSHRSLRFEGVGKAGQPSTGVVPASQAGFERVAAYDRRCFPAPRETFLRPWLTQPDSLALAAVDRDRVVGYGVARRCHEGIKIGPLFADDADVAESLYVSLAAFAPGEPVFLDVPEVNAWAMALVRRHRMLAVFGTARMYLGPPPRLDESRIFGITTFELG
jgi:GNAT superfamily N-acetyltransferase